MTCLSSAMGMCSRPWPIPPGGPSSTSWPIATARPCSRSVLALFMKHGLDSTRQAISQHLDVLEGAGLVKVRRDGRYKFHHLDCAPLKRDHRALAHPRLKGAFECGSYVTSVFVDDQEKALDFYTDILGFEKKTDIPLGELRVADRRVARRTRRHRAAARADRPPGRQAVQEGAGRGRDPVHLLRRRRRPGRVRSAARPRACGSPRSRSRWARSPRRSSTTPAATSSRSPSWRRR